MVMYNFQYLNPSINQLAMYCQFLGNTFPAPSTIRNYVSGARSWVYLHGGNVSPFLAPEMATMAKAIKEKSLHVPSPALPLTPTHLKVVCQYLDNTPGAPPAIKAAILLAYATFLRASNLAPHLTLIMPVSESILCPVRAWTRYKAQANPCPLGPAFMLSPSKALTSHVVVAVIRAALASAGYDNRRGVRS